MTNNPFWTWSVKAYALPGVRQACLSMQDRHGLNVNIILWICWLSQQGRNPLPVLDEAIKDIARWNSDMTQPIRNIRQAADRNTQPSLYQKLLDAELEAEKVEQSRLYDHSAGADTADLAPPATAQASLDAYAYKIDQVIDFKHFLKIVFTPLKKV